MSVNQYVATETVGAVALTQFRLVKVSGAAVVAAADTDIVIGVVQSGAAIGATVGCVKFGETKAIASGVIGSGVRVCPDSAGRIKAAVTGDMVCGFSLEAAGADGDEISIFFTPPIVVIA
jgi:hypothetical protein